MFKALPLALLALSLASQPAQAGTPTLALGTDLSDIHRYDADILLGDAGPILESMQPASPHFNSWFEGGEYSQVALGPDGKQRWRGPVAVQAVLIKNATERGYIVAAGLVKKSENAKITIRRYKVTFARPNQPNAGKVIRVEALATYTNAANDPLLPNEYRTNVNYRMDLDPTNLTPRVSAGLKLRIFMFKDEAHGLRFTYPLGVGGLDPGLETPITDPNPNAVNILTPTFSDARLEGATIWSHRNDQKHFRGEPFLRVMNGTKVCSTRRGVTTCRAATGADGWSAVGFHITIMGADYNNASKPVQRGVVKGPDGKDLTVAPPEWLTRGHDSHGCMRLRRNDLRFMHDLLLTLFNHDSKTLKLKPDQRRQVRVTVALENEPENNDAVRRGVPGAVMTEYTAWPLENSRYKRVKDYGPKPPTKAERPNLDCEVVVKADGTNHSDCRDSKDGGLVVTEQVPDLAPKEKRKIGDYVLAGVTAEDMEKLNKLNAMAEGADADERVRPPVCPPGMVCPIPEVPDQSEAEVLSQSDKEIVAPVPSSAKKSSKAPASENTAAIEK